jgi:hypothetical protein
LLPAGQKSRSNAASVADDDQQVQDGCARDAAPTLASVTVGLEGFAIANRK